MKVKWDIKDTADEDLINSLAYSLEITPIIANLLIQRGITTKDDAKIGRAHV